MGRRTKRGMVMVQSDIARYGRRLKSAARGSAAAVAVTAMLAGPAAAQSCATPDQLQSFAARVLQTRLMVAALSCDARSDYNAFVVTHQTALKRYGSTLKDFFVSSYGGGYGPHLNRYVTELANEASAISNANLDRFCNRSNAVMTSLKTSAGAGFDPGRYADFLETRLTAGEMCQTANR